MTLEEINRQESRIREAKSLYEKINTLRDFCDTMRKYEHDIDYFNIVFESNGKRIATIRSISMMKRYTAHFVRGMIESIEDHIAVMEDEVKDI